MPGSNTGEGKSLTFYLYYNGKVRTRDTIDDPSEIGGLAYSPDPGDVPPWFSWD